MTLSLVMLLLCGGCGAQSNPQSDGAGSSGMFSLFKNKNAATPSTVHPDVGAPLVRETTFPAKAVPAAQTEANGLTLLGLDGVPPQTHLTEDVTPGHKTRAFVASATSAHPALAAVNVVNGGDAHIEMWELSPGSERRFARQRTVRLDRTQSSWVTFLLTDVAALPGDRLLLSVGYQEPPVREALFVYDMTADTYTRIASLPRRRILDVVRPNADTALVLYYAGTTRVAPEIYYDAPSRIRLFSKRYPDGIDIIELGASDGSIERWTVSGKTLWIASEDDRKNDNRPQRFVWSLALDKVLP